MTKLQIILLHHLGDLAQSAHSPELAAEVASLLKALVFHNPNLDQRVSDEYLDALQKNIQKGGQGFSFELYDEITRPDSDPEPEPTAAPAVVEAPEPMVAPIDSPIDTRFNPSDSAAPSIHPITLKDQFKAFDEGRIIDTEGRENKCCNFFDWFCSEASLKNKALKLFPKVKAFVKRYDVDLDTVQVIFKNNCPVYGSLYDDFRICDIETGEVIWSVVPSSGHKSIKGQSEIWGRANGFEEAIVKAPSYREALKVDTAYTRSANVLPQI